MRNEDENLSCMKENFWFKLNLLAINADRNDRLRQTVIISVKAGFCEVLAFFSRYNNLKEITY
jgi:hypothetical protein